MAIRYKSLREKGNSLIVYREIDNDDGSVGVQEYTFPKTIFSIRAGEYGLDVEKDTDKIWDIILHEPLIPDEEREQHPLLVTEDSLESARDKHLFVCRTIRDRHENIGNPKKSKMHHEVLKAMHENSVVDRQLADLHRDRMKHESRRERLNIERTKNETASPLQLERRRLIDAIRQREEV